MFPLPQPFPLSYVHLDGLERECNDHTCPTAFPSHSRWYLPETNGHVGGVTSEPRWEILYGTSLDRKVWCSKGCGPWIPIYAGIVTYWRLICSTSFLETWAHWFNLQGRRALDCEHSVSAFPSWDKNHYKFWEGENRVELDIEKSVKVRIV